MRGWFGDPTWRTADFRTAAGLRKLAASAGLDALEIRGAIYYPRCATAARLLAPVDLWIGRKTTFGSAFLALAAVKPVRPESSESE